MWPSDAEAIHHATARYTVISKRSVPYKLTTYAGHEVRVGEHLSTVECGDRKAFYRY